MASFGDSGYQVALNEDAKSKLDDPKITLPHKDVAWLDIPVYDLNLFMGMTEGIGDPTDEPQGTAGRDSSVRFQDVE